MTDKTQISPEVARVLADLKSVDMTVRMMAISQALNPLISNAQGALEPFLVALSDKEQMIRMTVVQLFGRLDENMLRMALKTSEQADQLIHALEELPTKFEQDDAGATLMKLRAVKNKLENS